MVAELLVSFNKLKNYNQIHLCRIKNECNNVGMSNKKRVGILLSEC